MAIPTPQSLRRGRRRLDRLNAEVAAIVRAMRGGATLHLTYRPATTQWVLSTGVRVSDEVARVLIARGSVVGVGDSLFAGLSQTWRYCPHLVD